MARLARCCSSFESCTSLRRLAQIPDRLRPIRLQFFRELHFIEAFNRVDAIQEGDVVAVLSRAALH